MKIGVYADAHFSVSSSIVQGKSHTTVGRLDNLIESLAWMDQLFQSHKVDMRVDLGDLTDTTQLSSEVITALRRCNIDEDYHLLGNHSASSADGVFNSINMYEHAVISPTILQCSDTKVLLLPYNKEVIDLSEYGLNPNKDIILSHNDVKGCYYGVKLSDFGYDQYDIANNCKLFVNGHIHSGSWLMKDRIMNLGVVTGLNFNGTEASWNPSVGIIDTESGSIELFENPYALLFKKINASDKFDLVKSINSLDSSREYAIQVKVPYDIVKDAKELLDSKKFIQYRRVLIQYDKTNSKFNEIQPEVVFQSSSKSDYDKLRQYINNKTKMSADKSIVLQIIDEIESDE